MVGFGPRHGFVLRASIKNEVLLVFERNSQGLCSFCCNRFRQGQSLNECGLLLVSVARQDGCLFYCFDARKNANGQVSPLKSGCLLQLPWPKNGFVLLPLLLLSSKRTENTLPKKKTAIECPFWWQGNFLLWYLTENF